MTAPMRLTLFDLDHTLLPLDSDHAWGQFTVALGWRDFLGTGAFSGEYVVANKRTGNFDWSLGLGWGFAVLLRRITLLARPSGGVRALLLVSAGLGQG